MNVITLIRGSQVPEVVGVSTIDAAKPVTNVTPPVLRFDGFR